MKERLREEIQKITSENKKIQRVQELQQKIAKYEAHQMENLSDLKKVQNFLNDEALKRIDYSNRAHQAIKQSLKSKKGRDQQFMKSLDRFVGLTAQSATS